MVDIKTIISDPEFRRLSEADQVDVLRRIDPDFIGLSPEEQLKAVRSLPTLTKIPDIGKPLGIRGPLTWTEAVKTALKTTARALPEAAGFALGGTLGAAAGAPAGPPGIFAGAVTGAGLGSATGEAANQFLQRLMPSIFEIPGQEAPATSIEAGARIGKAASFGMTGEALGRGTAEVLPGLLKRALPQDTAQELAILEREGVPYTPGDVRPGGTAQQTENLVRGTLLGGRVMQQSDIAQAKRLFLFKKKLLDSIGRLFSKEELGDEIQQALEKRAVDLFGTGGIFDKSYSRLSTLYPAKVDSAYVRNEIAPLKAHLDQLVSEGRIGTAAPSPEAQSKYKVLIDRLSTYGSRETPQGLIDVPITYKQAWEDKQLVDGVIRSLGDDVLRTKAKGDLKVIHNIFDTAMEQAAQQTSPVAAKMIRKVNSAYKIAKELMETESVVASAREQRASEKVANMFFRTDAITPARDLLRAIPADKKKALMPIFRRRIIENIFEPATYQREESEVTSGLIARRRFDSAKDQLGIFFTKDQISAVDEFIQASQRAQKSGVMVNPASGRPLIAYSQLGSILQMVGAGVGLIQGQNMGQQILYSGAAIYGPKVLAQILTNPSMARTIAKGFTISPRTAFRTGWIVKAGNIFRIAQQKADQIQQQENQTQ